MNNINEKVMNEVLSDLQKFMDEKYPDSNIEAALDQFRAEHKKEDSDDLPEYECRITDDVSDEEVVEAGIKNVLLLTMSTLPARGVEGNHIRNEGMEDVIYYSQLEPVPLFLGKNGKAPDLVIILSSPEANSPQSNMLFDHKERITCSAVDFFKDRIHRALPETRFRTIISSSVEYGKSVSDTVSLIRSIRNSNKDAEFYMDMHGGLREAQLELDIIINLLKIEGINFKEIYTFEMGKNMVKEVSKTFGLFDLASGMNEFINFGRSANLTRYAGNIDESKKLMQCVKEVSDAVLLCQMDYTFDRALNNLENVIKNIKKSTKDSDYLRLFIEPIESSYGQLFRKRTIDNMLEWCMKHELYQQALTIVEAKFPDVFVRNYTDMVPNQYGIIDSDRWDGFKHEEINNGRTQYTNYNGNRLYGVDNETDCLILIRSLAQCRSKRWSDNQLICTNENRNRKGDRYTLTFKNGVAARDIADLLDIWYRIKSKYRNSVNHMSDEKDVTVVAIRKDILDFIAKYKSLDASVKNVQR